MKAAALAAIASIDDGTSPELLETPITARSTSIPNSSSGTSPCSCRGKTTPRERRPVT